MKYDDRLYKFDTDMKLPLAVLDLLTAGHCMVAGGSVVRHLIGAESSDIDVFFYGVPDASLDAFHRAVGSMVMNCWAASVSPPVDGERTYPHERVILRKDGLTIDLIWCDVWDGPGKVLDGFDLTCCSVGVLDLAADGAQPPTNLQLVAAPQAVHALMTRSYTVWKNVWPTTPSRRVKYGNLGFRDATPPASMTEEDPF